MESKTPNTARLLSCIKEALSSSSPDVSIDFVCGTIVLFEKHFGQKNKTAMQKILKEAIENFGPETPFSDNASMLPVYSMLTKYSKSLSVSEIFERLYRKGSYRRCAKFYVEWCKSCREIPKKLEVLDLASQENAEPADLLQLAKEEVRTSVSLATVQDDSPTGNPSSHDHVFLRRKPHAEKSAKRALFSGRTTNIVENHRLSERVDTSNHGFLLPDVGTSWRAPMTSDSPPPSSFEVSVRRSSGSSESLPSPDPNAENINPSGVLNEPVMRRKLAGVLVASLEFTLEDYDLSDDAVAYFKSSEMLKKEDNEANIRNNMPSDETEQSGSCFPSLSNERRLTPSPTLSDHW